MQKLFVIGERFEWKNSIQTSIDLKSDTLFPKYLQMIIRGKNVWFKLKRVLKIWRWFLEKKNGPKISETFIFRVYYCILHRIYFYVWTFKALAFRWVDQSIVHLPCIFRLMLKILIGINNNICVDVFVCECVSV